ncbi:hypothetical protein BTVI_95009 [Pitangus sulphuratus]|nr:hypothetical protein BTVI_95009 [Pitangus sulphuratus]
MPSRGTLTGGQLERWACVNLMKFNKAKGKVVHISRGNPKHRYRLGGEWIESNPEEDSGMFVNKKLRIFQEHALATQKVNCIWGSFKRSMASRTQFGLPKTQEIPPKYKIEECKGLLYVEYVRALDQAARGDHGVFISGDTQNPLRHIPAPGDPSLAGGLD